MALDLATLQLGASIALLKKFDPRSGEVTMQNLLNGIREAKALLERSDLASDAGDNLEIANIRQKIVIASQLADLTMNIAAQNVGVYLQPEWAAKTGIDKFFESEEYACSSLSGVYISYAVPAGKTLYIVGFGYGIEPSDMATNGEKPRRAISKLEGTTVTPTLYGGSDGGTCITLTQPLTVPAGDTFVYRVWNSNTFNVDIFASCWGYEVEN